jgi:glycosyltransferase involved in cell wall biosynthesis
MKRASPNVSVVTATYDRAGTLARLYESLVNQTYADFEWIVVDDGSEDATESIVRAWMADEAVDIVYVRQPNRGKHVAVNRGVERARGELTTVIDSDDRYLPGALEVLTRRWYEIPLHDRPRFAGVRALCAFENGEIVGDEYPVDPLDCDAAELTHVHGVAGDKPILLRTEVLREFPFPFEHVGYVTEALVWHRIALRYLERHVNEVVVIVEYRDDGLSARANELLVRGAPASRQYFLEEAQIPHRVSLRRRVRAHANYVRYSLHAATGLRQQLREAPSKGAWLGLAPLGVGLYLRDKRRFASRAEVRGERTGSS